MLLNSTADVQLYETTSSGLDFDDLKPYINKAEKILKKAISKDMYDVLNAAVQGGGPLSSELNELLDNCRSFIAPLAIQLYSKVGQIKISSQGFQIDTTDSKKQAFQWQMLELRAELHARAYQALDETLAEMEASTSNVYDPWRNSNAYTVFKKNFIQTATQFTEFYNIRGSRYMLQLLQPFINQAEEGIIKNTILPGLYDTLKTELAASNLTPENAKLVQLLQPAVAGFAMAKGLLQISVEIGPNGITVFNNENSQTVETHVAANNTRINQLREDAEAAARAALDRAINYVLANLGDYPTYTADPGYIADVKTYIPHFTSTNKTTVFL